jgi:hypothetical protein
MIKGAAKIQPPLPIPQRLRLSLLVQLRQSDQLRQLNTPVLRGGDPSASGTEVARAMLVGQR